MGYFVGLDLGQSQDYTALAIVQSIAAPPSERYDPYTGRVVRVASRLPPTLHVRHLERFPLGTRYPAIVTAVQQRIQAIPPDPMDNARHELVIDKTGVGAPVVDLFDAAGLEPKPITITSGNEPARDGVGWHVPKRDLVSTLQVVLQNKRLQVAQSLPAAATLTQELLNFKVKITLAANDIYGAWREGQHDDLVLAVAMAVWYIEHGYSPPWTAEDLQALNHALRDYRG